MNINKNINNCKILCENEVCIYQKNDSCILKKIDLDNVGCCQSCIYVNIDEEQLKLAKQKLLDKFNN